MVEDRVRQADRLRPRHEGKLDVDAHVIGPERLPNLDQVGQASIALQPLSSIVFRKVLRDNSRVRLHKAVGGKRGRKPLGRLPIGFVKIHLRVRVGENDTKSLSTIQDLVVVRRVADKDHLIVPLLGGHPPALRLHDGAALLEGSEAHPRVARVEQFVHVRIVLKEPGIAKTLQGDKPDEVAGGLFIRPQCRRRENAVSKAVRIRDHELHILSALSKARRSDGHIALIEEPATTGSSFRPRQCPLVAASPAGHGCLQTQRPIRAPPTRERPRRPCRSKSPFAYRYRL